jgi:adenylosuccinate lyase
MMTIFSARERASTWRQLWVWLAEAEKELGLPIPDEALEQMRANVTVSDKAFAVARDYEAKFRVWATCIRGDETKSRINCDRADNFVHTARCHGPCPCLWRSMMRISPYA